MKYHFNNKQKEKNYTYRVVYSCHSNEKQYIELIKSYYKDIFNISLKLIPEKGLILTPFKNPLTGHLSTILTTVVY